MIRSSSRDTPHTYIVFLDETYSPDSEDSRSFSYVHSSRFSGFTYFTLKNATKPRFFFQRLPIYKSELNNESL